MILFDSLIECNCNPFYKLIKQLMEPANEKQFNTKSTYDTFDEIYTNYDLSVDNVYSASSGYPFDYPIRWLNDPSMNKRIAIRRLEATPTSHTMVLMISAKVDDELTTGNDVPEEEYYEKTINVDITYKDNLIKVMNYICNECGYENRFGMGGLMFKHDNKTNILEMFFVNSAGMKVDFQIEGDADEFLRFLNQEVSDENQDILVNDSKKKVFNEVWNRDRLHFHASFSTSRRHFIGKRGDFYQNLTLLYPPSNETTFNIRFTSDGYHNILLLYTEFDVQLCFIVNYMKSIVL